MNTSGSSNGGGTSGSSQASITTAVPAIQSPGLYCSQDEDLPDLHDKDVEKVAKKMQFVFRSKKLHGTPPYMAAMPSLELIFW